MSLDPAVPGGPSLGSSKAVVPSSLLAVQLICLSQVRVYKGFSYPSIAAETSLFILKHFKSCS